MQRHLLKRTSNITNTLRTSSISNKQFFTFRFYAAAAKDSKPQQQAATPNTEQQVKKLRPQEDSDSNIRFGGQDIPAHILQALREKKYDKLSKGDFTKLEQTLDKMVTQTHKFEDESSTSTPFNMINILLAAIALVFAIARTRDAMENEHLQELLFDTEQELGSEVLRLKQQRTQWQAQVKQFVPPEKQQQVDAIFAQMEQQDKDNVKRIWSNKKQQLEEQEQIPNNVNKLNSMLL